MIDRRDFVSVLIGSGVAGLAAPASCFAIDEASAASAAIVNIPPDSSIRALGAEYLRLQPRFRQRAILSKEIFGASMNLTSESGVLEFLRKSIANDFERGATLRIKGWVYAQTELELCALTMA